uniref:Coenzyme A biosynthesis bifunctional protein CoaBC n=1 Tax=Fervidicoccus fontis TaxID=683846 RepID=A0A7J3ZM43_9CREN
MQFWENHPSKRIIGEVSRELQGKKIVLGVTSSVAAYKSIELARELMRYGAEVTVVMSEEATRLISPSLFEWATGNPVFHTRFSGETGHILLADTHDAMVVAPATASTLAKISQGIVDTTVSLTAHTFIGANKPVIVVPVMHKALYDAMTKTECIYRLERLGVIVHKPLIRGDKVRFPEPHELAWHIETILTRGKDFAGSRVLVTAGPTREYIDAVRFVSNPSSGKMGVSLALEALFRGAHVSLVHGPIVAPHSIDRSFEVETTEEMLCAVLKEVEEFKPNIVILAAAPTDFKPSRWFEGKLRSEDTPITLELVATPKVAEKVRESVADKAMLVLFVAEPVASDSELVELALKKKSKYKADVVVANNIARKDIGFSSDHNEVLVIYGEDNRVVKIGKTLKRIVARRVLDVIGGMLGKQGVR